MPFLKSVSHGTSTSSLRTRLVPVGKIVSRESASVGFSRIRVHGGRPRGAAASAKDVRADYMVAVGVDGAPRPDHALPPSAWLRFTRADAGHMGVSGKGMADEHDIVEFRAIHRAAADGE